MTRPPLLIISDVDGCLLDTNSYSFDAAQPALTALKRIGVGLVPCSGKTRAELTLLVSRLGLTQPFIVENGGALVLPRGGFCGNVPGAREQGDFLVVQLGPSRDDLMAALRSLAAEVGVRVRGFSDLTPLELQRLTGLSGPASLLALRREYDEPFLLEAGEDRLPALARAAAARGLRLSHGGRFHHLTGGADKGLAVRMLLAVYARQGRSFSTVGLGDAETDLPMLQAVDRPILIPRLDGQIDPALAASLPAAERAPRPGPTGWNEAVLAVLCDQSLAPARVAPAANR